jgi:hypothetical protein
MIAGAMLEVADEELEPASPCSCPSPTAANADDPIAVAVANPDPVAATAVTGDSLEGCMFNGKAWLNSKIFLQVTTHVVTRLKTRHLHDQ